MNILSSPGELGCPSSGLAPLPSLLVHAPASLHLAVLAGLQAPRGRLLLTSSVVPRASFPVAVLWTPVRVGLVRAGSPLRPPAPGSPRQPSPLDSRSNQAVTLCLLFSMTVSVFPFFRSLPSTAP